MTVPKLFVTLRSEYEDSKSQCDAVIERSRRLPQHVFQPRLDHFLLLDFDRILSADFIRLLQSGVRELDEVEIKLSLIEPDPAEYFYSNFGIYGTLDFTVATSAEELIDAIAWEPQDSPADALLYNSAILCAYSPSARWAVWADREHEIAVVAWRPEASRLGAHLREHLIGLSIDEALDRVAMAFPSQIVPTEFIASFSQNYSASETNVT
ncbi:hypothetical protein [Gemmatimonas sp.]|uniref:hypothetical protein n=1 Tax=Gemmatimonas sp. TaxID=1962908 RepID=UPI00286A9441|nr:hypothetical protein [Gemmatimonas sp.]